MLKLNLSRWLLAVFTLVGVNSAFSQASELTFTLEQARTHAVEHSYFTQKAILDQQMAIKKMKEVTAIGLPQINASVNYRNNIELATFLIPDASGGSTPAQFGTQNNLTGGLSVSQLIFNGSYLVGLQAAKSYREMSDKVVIKSEREIKDAVTQAYGNVQIAVENVITIEGNYTFLLQTLEETQALYSAGFAREQDVDQLTILTQSAQNEFNKAERLVDISENFLKFQMGIESTSTIILTDSLDFIVAYGNDSIITQQGFDVNAHIDYKIALNSQDLQYLNYKNTKAEFMPNIGAFYQYEQQYQSDDMTLNSESWFPTSMWGIQMNIPIFSSFQRRYVMQQADINFQKAQVNSQQVEQSLMVEFLTLKSEYQFSVDQYKNAENNLELVQKIVNKETQKYKEGMSSSLNLANAQIQFFQIQGAYVQSIMGMVKARSNMDKILSNY